MRILFLKSLKPAFCRHLEILDFFNLCPNACLFQYTKNNFVYAFFRSPMRDGTNAALFFIGFVLRNIAFSQQGCIS